MDRRKLRTTKKSGSSVEVQSIWAERVHGGILDVFVLEALGYPELYVSLDVGGESKQGGLNQV
jgi:hypothetical protein